MITKSNAQRHAYGLWDRVLVELAPEFADVAVEKLHIDAATLHLVRRPHTFDVIVGSNLFGDILSDLTGGITGSLGLEPVRQSRSRSGRYPSLFEPVHGSAPDIAGKGIANPAGAILSAAMMLEWLGQEPGRGRAAQGGGARVCRRKSDAGFGRELDHGGADGGNCRAGDTVMGTLRVSQSDVLLELKRAGVVCIDTVEARAGIAENQATGGVGNAFADHFSSGRHAAWGATF